MSAPTSATIRVDGRDIVVPAAVIGDRTVYRRGRLLRMGQVLDEELVEGDAIGDPADFIPKLKRSGLGVDILTFPQRFWQKEARHPLPYEMENAAVIPITTPDDWFKNRVGSKTRNVVRKAQKCGVEVRVEPLTDAFVDGVVKIYNETPIRQGRPFWHYGKNAAQVKHELSHCTETSRFLAAHCEGEMVGFAKLLRKGQAYDFVLILSMDKHRNKYVTNAIIAKAVEVCAAEKMPWLQYARYTYAHKEVNPLTDFKKHNGFEQVDFPRYYVPLTLRGRLAFKLGLHHGIKGLLPVKFLDYLRNLRARMHARSAGSPPAARAAQSGAAEPTPSA